MLGRIFGNLQCTSVYPLHSTNARSGLTLKEKREAVMEATGLEVTDNFQALGGHWALTRSVTGVRVIGYYQSRRCAINNFFGPIIRRGG